MPCPTLMKRDANPRDRSGHLAILLPAIATLVIAGLGGESLAAEKQGDKGSPPRRPNVVFILGDDLGYGDLGCYGQRQILTPHIDKMAREGLRCLDCYAGCTVCAPSRCALMTGYHMGHARVRGNGAQPLEAADVTVAELFQQAGYATCLIGKWGLGDADTSGSPGRKGFGEWFGFLDQTHAHNYFPEHLWRNGERVSLPNVVKKGVSTNRAVYAPDLFIDAALKFIEQNRDRPFFLYFASTLPHANNEAHQAGTQDLPSDEPYGDRPWPPAQRGHAAMITRLDRDAGRLLDQLAALGLDEKTVVFFSSDNGAHVEGGAKIEFFHDAGALRGHKRDLYEGGIRVPMIVRYPGHVAAGQSSEQPWAFWDFLPTAADAIGAAPPQGIDGISMWPTLVGPSAAGHEQAAHGPLYWEFREKGRGYWQAVRKGRWKGIRNPRGEIELYDLATDVGEERDVASQNPQVAAELAEIMRTSHKPSPRWPTPNEDPPAPAGRQDPPAPARPQDPPAPAAAP